MTIVKHRTSDTKLYQSFRPVLMEFVQNVTVHAVKNLKANIVLKEQHVTVGTAKVNDYLQQDGHSWHFYIDSCLSHMDSALVMKSLARHMMSVMAPFCVTASDHDLKEVRETLECILCAQTSGELQSFLDREGLKLEQSDASELHFESRITPELGKPILESWIHRLDQHLNNIFAAEEWVGYEEEEGRIVFAQIAYPILPDDDEAADSYVPSYMRKYKIFTKEDDEEGKEVGALDLYKFLRGLKPARPEPSDAGNQDRVPYEEDSDASQVREAAGAQEPPDITSIKEQLCKDLLQIWTLSPEDRVKAIRRLYLQWHPDKNPDQVELAEEVFRFLRQQIERLEKGLPLNDPTDTGPTARAYEYLSAYWGDRFRHHQSWQSEHIYRQQRLSRTQHHTYDEFMNCGPMKEPEEGKRWLRQAEYDHTALCALFGVGSSDILSHVCFMAHQVAEKALKGGMYALCGLGERSLESHNLTPLAYALEAASPALREADLAELVKPLESYYLDARYPNRHPRYTIPSDPDVHTPEKARQAKEAADLIVELIRNVVN